MLILQVVEEEEEEEEEEDEEHLASSQALTGCEHTPDDAQHQVNLSSEAVPQEFYAALAEFAARMADTNVLAEILHVSETLHAWLLSLADRLLTFSIH